jgi:hypothetical protein
MDNTTTRRAIVEGLLSGAIQPSGIMTAPPQSPDRALIAQWNKRQRALASIESRGAFYDCRNESPRQLERYDDAELAVAKMPAHTPQGVLAKLWVALSHAGDGFGEQKQLNHALIRRADLAECEASIDWPDFEYESLFGALSSLSTIVEDNTQRPLGNRRAEP